MGLYSGGGGAYIRGTYIQEEKHFNLQSVKLTFFFPSIKHVFRNFSRRARCETCSKLTRKVNDKVKKKPLTSFWHLCC